MKNQFKITLFALGALALGACTDNDVVSTDNPVINGAGGDSYISLAINLPTQTAARAANDVYDDGLAAEYNVNDATLYLFSGTDEATATLYASYTLIAEWGTYSPTDDNITSRQSFTQQIDTPASGSLYALVILNNNGLLNNISNGVTFSSLQTTIQTFANGVDSMTADGFFMCNAPLTSTPGGSYVPEGSGVTTLAYIDNNKIFTSAAEAASHPATEIYVERGMAKVTVVDGTGTSATVGDTEIPVTIDGFVLDLTNNVSYLVRNTTGSENWWSYTSGYSTNYRMAGNVEVGSGLYRTYWATDPNYSFAPYISGDEGERNYGTVMTSLAGTSPTLGNVGAENPQYCLENTFNVAHMNQDETTRVIIGATLYDGEDFFIWDNDKTTAYLDDDDLIAGDATTGLEKIKALILTEMHAEGYLEEAEAAWVGPFNEETQEYDANMYDYITIVFDDEETTTGLVASDDLTFHYTVSDEVNANWFVNPDDRTQPLNSIPAALVVSSTAYDAVVEDLNTHHQVAYYEGGESYYPVLIEHFGDDLTYWDEQYSGTTGTANEQSYPADVWSKTVEENWLGRYGVLRNNWYEINVTGVNTIGSATVPTAYGDPDDPTQKWISIEINILSWAKRTQSVTL